MTKSLSLFFIFLLSYCSIFAQYSQVKGALKNQEKGKFDKVDKLLNKAIEKDSSLAAVLYAKASILSDSAYQEFNIDSAYQNILQSKASFALLDEKSVSQHMKLEIDSLAIHSLKGHIERAAFNRASKKNTEEAYIDFLNNFFNTSYDEIASKRRDSIAFSTAKKINTYQSYQTFIETYPEASEITEAKKRYEKLYFNKSTADGKLESYIGFLEQHPSTVYRKEAESKILDLSTADNSRSSFIKFLSEYPVSALAPKAKRLLFHLNEIEYSAATDSITQVVDLQNKGPLTLFYETDKYGFMDSLGNIVVAPKYTEIKERYLCTSLENDFFVTKDKVIARNGALIFSGFFDDAHDLGMGVLEINTASGSFIMHKSGWPISSEKFQEVKKVGDFIAYKQNDLWGLMALTGLKLTSPQFDDILNVADFYLFKFNDQFDVLNRSLIAKSANKSAIKFQALYSDYELINNHTVWLQSSYGETIFDHKLTEVIPYDKQEIIPLEQGYIVIKDQKITLLNKEFSAQLESISENMDFNNSYLTIENEASKSLISLTTFEKMVDADSLQVLGNHFALSYTQDSIFLHFRNNLKVLSKRLDRLKLIASNSSAQYLAVKVSAKGDWLIYDKEGKIIIRSDFDDIIAIGKEYLVITKKGKKGLYSSKGEQLLESKYDAIANYNNGYITYFSDKKFGVVNDSLGITIKNEYDRNIAPYNMDYMIVQKGDYVGLVNRSGDEMTTIDYEEIVYWNDTSALVKKDYQWLFLTIKSNKFLSPSLKSFRYVKNTDEKIIIGLVDNRYGVFSNLNGEIIPATFNDIINVGSSENPLYFTEKHVEEAEFYVVIYYNSSGKLIRKQVFESEDYSLIYCED